ncbi:MAG: hypothetical protein GY795_32000 [Desulfobacterales bacterium]|nr:hypothetical protein [Desulfobacterales bacterium]
MKTLAIGIGGVGKVALMKLRKMIVEEYGSLDQDIQFLHIDTYKEAGQEASQNFQTRVIGRDITLTPPERLVVSNGLPEPPRTKHLAEHPHVVEWFPADLPVNVNLAQGAGGVRAYGRLAIHHKIAEFRRKMKNILTNFEGGAQVDIYIVNSFFGGTGSGAFLDICYNVRDMRDQIGINGEIAGFFVAGANAPDEVMQVNSYTALMELEYYMTGGKKPFEARYPVGGVPNVISGDPPVDTCYFFGSNNGYKIFNRGELEETVARRMFFETVPGIRGPMIAKRVDIKATPAYYMPDSLQKRAKTFFCTGCSVVEFPSPRLMNLLGTAFAAYCCHHLLYEQAPGFSDLKRAVRDFIENKLQFKFTQEHLTSELGKQDTRTVSISMKEDRTKWLNELREKIRDQGIHEEAENIVNRAVDLWGDKGTYALTVKNNLNRVWNAVEGDILKIITSLAADDNIGPHHTSTYIERVISELKNDQKRARDAYDRADAVLRLAREKVDRKLNHIRDDQKIRWALSKHIQWLCNRELAVFMEQARVREVNRNIQTLLGRLIHSLGMEKEKIDHYISRLNHTEGAFSEEASELCRNLLEWIKGESSNHSVYLDKLKEFLEGYLQKGRRQLDTLLKGLAAAYQIRDPFDGNTGASAGAVVKNIGNPFNRLMDGQDGFKTELFDKSRKVFADFSRINICDLLTATLSDDMKNRLFEEKISLSEWCLDVFTNDLTIDHNPAIHEKKWVGVPNSVALDSHSIWNGPLAGYDPDSQRFNALEEPYRMVFATETGVFCMRNIQFLDIYAKSYRAISAPDRQNRHIHYYVEYPDIMPPDPRLFDIQLRVERAELLGKIFGFLKQGSDPETHYSAIYLHHSDSKTGARLNQKLCDEWKEVEPGLKMPQIEKEIEKTRTDVTLLEIIEEEIRRLAGSKKVREYKQVLCGQMQEYLKDVLGELGEESENQGDAEMHPVYQKKQRIINEFMKEYNMLA